MVLKMSAFDKYKVYRNQIRKYNLEKSLVGLWQYENHILNGGVLPASSWYYYKNGSRQDIQACVKPWQVETVLKELIINASCTGSICIDSFSRLAFILDAVNDVSNEFDAEYLNESNIFYGVYKILNQQVPWQGGSRLRGMQRYFELFSAANLDEIFHDKYGVTVSDAYLIGMFFYAMLQKSPYVDISFDFGTMGLDAAAAKTYVDSLIIDVKNCQSQLRDCARYDGSWLYSPNCLRDYPLVRMNSGRIICPMPSLLLMRLTSGIYYGLVTDKRFSNAFGDAFEDYVGSVVDGYLKYDCEVLKETPYVFDKSARRGFDYCVKQNGMALLIECKTLRPRFDTKSAPDNETAEKDFSKLSSAVFQSLKNLNDIILGRTTWSVKDEVPHVLVVTLENWFADWPSVAELIHNQFVTTALKEGFDKDFVEKFSYSICSIEEFEMLCGVAATSGLSEVLAKKLDGDNIKCNMHGFLISNFSESLEAIDINSTFALWGVLEKRLAELAAGAVAR